MLVPHGQACHCTSCWCSMGIKSHVCPSPRCKPSAGPPVQPMALKGIRKDKSPSGLKCQEAHHGNQSRNSIISACSRSTGEGSEGNQGSCFTPVSPALLASSMVLWGCWGCHVLRAEHGMKTRSPRAYLPSGTWQKSHSSKPS